MRLCERVFAGVGQRREPGRDGNGNPVSVGCIVVGQDSESLLQAVSSQPTIVWGEKNNKKQKETLRM